MSTLAFLTFLAIAIAAYTMACRYAALAAWWPTFLLLTITYTAAVIAALIYLIAGAFA